MPLHEVAEPSLKGAGNEYILFFASGSPPWCPDCREALPAIEEVFGNKSSSLVLQVVKVGMKDEWKSPSNRWRGEPYHVTSTPSIIKFKDSKEVNRLGDQECKSVDLLRDLIRA